ncbi:MAG: hypothetical protein ACK5RG_22080 [Cyclobacteriaceae bacterium]|jgi:hypothetical protein|nr:hypothetical protein [Flammeovirgaceae bacterium]
MSHTKNVEAFEKLVGVCAGCGSKYNPAQEKLQLVNMYQLLAIGQVTLQNCSDAKIEHNNAGNTREVSYQGLGKLAVRIVGELKSSGVLEQTVNDAKSALRLIKGHRTPSAVKQTTAGANGTAEPPVKKRRARGTDYATMAQHFQLLVKTVAAEPAYQPESADLKVSALNGKVYELLNNNSKLIQVWSSLMEARKKRDEVLYDKKTGLVSIAKAAKQKVMAIFGTTSTEYQQIAHIRFTIK